MTTTGTEKLAKLTISPWNYNHMWDYFDPVSHLGGKKKKEEKPVDGGGSRANECLLEATETR